MPVPSRKRAAPDSPASAPDSAAEDVAAGLALSFVADVEAGDRLQPLLLRLRSGPPPARKQALRQLSASPQVRPLLELALAALREPDIDAAERHRITKLVVRVLLRCRSSAELAAVAPLTQPLLLAAQDLLLDAHRPARAMGQELLASLARAVGLHALLSTLRPEFATSNDRTRLATASALAAVAVAFGIPLLLPLLRALASDAATPVRLLAMLTLRRLPANAGSSGVLPHLAALVDCCRPALAEPQISSAACAALRALAEAVAPFGIEAFEPVLPALWAGLRRRGPRPASVFLRTLATLVPLVEPSQLPGFATPLLTHAAKDYESTDDEIRRTALVVTQLCAASVDPAHVAALLPQIFDHFWTPRVAADARTAALVVATTSGVPADYSTVLAELVQRNVLVSESIDLQAMGLSLLSRLGSAPLLLDRRLEERLVDGLVAMQPAPGAVHAVVNIVASLGPERLAAHEKRWVQSLVEQQASPDEAQRAFSTQILRALAPELSQPQLQLLQRHLYEQLGEEYPDALAEVMAALNAVVSASQEPLDPPVTTVIPRVVPVLRNRNEKVQEACIRLINALAEIDGESVSAREWINVCFELLQLQSSHRVTVRRLATSTFAAIAGIIGPQDVVVNLLGQLRSNDRQLRITSAAAIAAVGAHTGPFTVLPIILNEYRSQDVVVQHGVLKTLAFLFEFVDKGQAATYVDSLVSLIDHALLQQNQVHRQTAASAVQHLALGCVARGKEPIFVHFLNELMPSIFETSPHVIDRVLESIEAIHLVIGTAAMVNYLWAGLFHPARKVRTAYWRVWNMLYVYRSDALVPVYPVKVPSLNDDCEDLRDLWV